MDDDNIWFSIAVLIVAAIASFMLVSCGLCVSHGGAFKFGISGVVCSRIQ